MSKRLLDRRRPHARRSAFLLAVLMVAALAACSGESGGPGQGRGGGARAGGGRRGPGGGPGERDAIAVHVDPVRREPLSSLYSTSATLRADKQATVIARTRGVVERLAVEEGARVEKDQILAELENDEQEIDVDIARTAEANTRRELERARRLFEQSLLSEEDFEATRRAAEEARHVADRAELTLSRTIIRAPFSGRILRRHLDLGATVADGTAIFDLADVEPLYADVNVPERHVEKLSAGQTVRLAADSAGVNAEARIERIAPAVDPESGTVKVTVAVGHAPGLRPGTFVRVDVVTDTHPDALVVPRSALVAEGRRWHVFRLAQDRRTVEQLEVLPGFEEGDRVEILDVVGDGPMVDEETLVVVLGAGALNDGAPVRVMEPDDGEPGDADAENQARSASEKRRGARVAP